MVKVSEISKHMDLTEVQLYIINGAKVVFLRRRPQPKAPRGTSSNYTCTVCGRHLQVCAVCGFEREVGGNALLRSLRSPLYFRALAAVLE